MSTKSPNRDKGLGAISPADVPVGMMPTVELSKEQVHQATQLAKDRNQSYTAIDGGQLFGPNTSLTSHQVGILGELAVAVAYPAEIDKEQYEFGDDGADLSIWGNRVDVKSTATTAMTRPELLVRADRDVTADLYMLTHLVEWGPNGAVVRLLGYTTRENVLQRTPRQHPGQMENYVVTPQELSLPPWTQA